MNLNDLQMWHYGVIIGGALLVLSFILYFLPTRKLKVPAVLTAGVVGWPPGWPSASSGWRGSGTSR